MAPERADPLPFLWRRRLAQSRLSPRQREIMALVAAGLDNVTIGARLGLPVQSVKNHLTRILRALGANYRGHAVLLLLGLTPESALWRARLARTPLTPRQREVLSLIAFGASEPEICARLGCRSQTVRNHRMNSYGRLGARSRAHAVGLVLGLAEPVDRSKVE